MKKNLVFGSSGLVGSAFYNLIKDHKNFIFYSKNDRRFKKFNLNSNLKNFPFKNVNNCYFFSSPRILRKNFINNNFKLEFDWLKKIILNIKINKLIYISSSSVYFKKNHIIGSVKLKCENFIIKKKDIFANYQIWRPFNLVGNHYNLSDHFHNILFKKMFIQKKKSSSFYGNLDDIRGFSNVDEFVSIILKFSNKKKSFLKDYGNLNVIKLIEIVNLFNKNYFKLNNKLFKCKFLNKKKNINTIKYNKNNVYSKQSSLYVFKNYLRNSIDVKKV